MCEHGIPPPEPLRWPDYSVKFHSDGRVIHRVSAPVARSSRSTPVLSSLPPPLSTHISYSTPMLSSSPTSHDVIHSGDALARMTLHDRSDAYPRSQSDPDRGRDRSHSSQPSHDDRSEGEYSSQPSHSRNHGRSSSQIGRAHV